MIMNPALTCMDRSFQLRLQNVRMEYQSPGDQHVRHRDSPSLDRAPKKKKSQSHSIARSFYLCLDFSSSYSVFPSSPSSLVSFPFDRLTSLLRFPLLSFLLFEHPHPHLVIFIAFCFPFLPFLSVSFLVISTPLFAWL